MKLLIAADIFPPESGGPATYAVTLANELTKQGVDVRIVSLNPNSDKTKVICPVFAVASSFKPVRYWQYYKLLLTHGKDIDVIYAMGPVNAGLPAWIVARILRKKFVVKVVGDYAWEQALVSGYFKGIPLNKWPLVDEFQNRKLKGKIKFLQKVEHFVCRKSNKIIVPSEYLKRVVSMWGVSSEKIVTIYNSAGLSRKSGAITRDDARKKFNFGANDFIIISAGRAVPWKGFGLLALTVADLIQKGETDIKLRLLGVDNADEVRRLIKLFNDKVIFEQHPLKNSDLHGKILRVEDKHLEEFGKSGNVPKETVYEYLHAADLFVLNSGYEGLSHAILEALLIGVPVIASNIGGNPELIEDNKNGLLIGYNNKEDLLKAIKKIKNNPTLRAMFVKNSEPILKKFDKEIMTSRTKELLESL